MSQPMLGALVSLKGRITRTRFLCLTLLLIGSFILAFNGLEQTLGRGSTLLLYPLLFVVALSLACRRYHDLDKSGWWLLLVLIPLIGPFWVGIELLLRRGTAAGNRYGDDPRTLALDYLQVG